MNCCESHTTMGRVVCPTPRRLGPFHADHRLIMPFKFLIRNDTGSFDTKQGAESMGLIFYKEDHEVEQCKTLASPPFFFRSPPCRAPNPLVQDSHFGLENLNPPVFFPIKFSFDINSSYRSRAWDKTSSCTSERF